MLLNIFGDGIPKETEKLILKYHSGRGEKLHLQNFRAVVCGTLENATVIVFQ